jgi:hypothetical protein
MTHVLTPAPIVFCAPVSLRRFNYQLKPLKEACTLTWQSHPSLRQLRGQICKRDQLEGGYVRSRLASRARAAAAPIGSGGAEAATVGVVIVDHGSRRAQSNEMLVEFAALYR